MSAPAFLLRAPTLADVDASIAIHCDDRTNAFRPGGSPPAEEAAAYIPTWQKHWQERGFGYWAVVRAADQAVVGFGGITLKEVGPHFGLNLYFRLVPEVWSQGLTRLIGQASFEEAFVRREHERVLGLVRPHNLPSRRALERLGLVAFDECEDVPSEAPSLIYQISRAAYLEQLARP